jgi:hypothetical protein
VDNTQLGKKAGKFLVDYSDPTKEMREGLKGMSEKVVIIIMKDQNSGSNISIIG